MPHTARSPADRPLDRVERSVFAGAWLTLDAGLRITDANDAVARLLGVPAQELPGRGLWTFFPRTARRRLEERLLRARERGEPVQLEERDASHRRWLELRSHAFGGGLAVHLQDATARMEALRHLRLLEGSIARLNDIVIITEAAPFGEPGPRIVFVNEAFERRTGYARAEVLGRSPRFLQGPQTQREALDALRAGLERWERVRVDLVNYTRAGEPYWVDLDVSPVWDEDRRLTHWVAVGRDISGRKAAEARIRHLAFHDQLTGLPNRQQLLERLEAALAPDAPPRPGALMFIDLDHFKGLNDTLGHASGDQLLQQVGQRLRASVAQGDLVARLGGDEFVVLLEGKGGQPLAARAAAQAVSARILAALGEPYVLPGHLHHGTCSMGVTVFGDAPVTVSELLKQADLAMYQAKAAGRNAVRFFDPGMQAAASAHAALAADLRQAWRDRELQLEYQPQVAADGRVLGVEALLRWDHPRRGGVPPTEFIPMAEETGLILPIGLWVVETACAQLAAWAGRPGRDTLGVAVNVSVRQFRHPEFVDEVLARVRRHGVRPGRLKLELTESLLAEDIEATVARMERLKAHGVGLALDDFGTGYSSLAYLKRLPLDELKIDRAFVQELLTGPKDAAIARAIVALAHSLGLGVIAEGVETSAQRDALAGYGCGAFQGWLFGPALPPARLEAFLEQASTPAPSSAAP